MVTVYFSICVFVPASVVYFYQSCLFFSLCFVFLSCMIRIHTHTFMHDHTYTHSCMITHTHMIHTYTHSCMSTHAHIAPHIHMITWRADHTFLCRFHGRGPRSLTEEVHDLCRGPRSLTELLLTINPQNQTIFHCRSTIKYLLTELLLTIGPQIQTNFQRRWSVGGASLAALAVSLEEERSEEEAVACGGALT